MAIKVRIILHAPATPGACGQPREHPRYGWPIWSSTPRSSAIDEDPLLRRVLDRALAVQPAREILVHEFGKSK